VDIVKKVAPALIKGGKYTYAYLGLSGGSLTPDLAQAMGLPADMHGVLVMKWSRAGLRTRRACSQHP